MVVMSTSGNVEMYPVLQDLEAVGNKNPSVLGHFTQYLNGLLLSNNSSCRSLAFSL